MVRLFLCNECHRQGLILLDTPSGDKLSRFVFSRDYIELMIIDGQKLNYITLKEGENLRQCEAYLSIGESVATAGIELQSVHADLYHQIGLEDLILYQRNLPERQCNGKLQVLG